MRVSIHRAIVVSCAIVGLAVALTCGRASAFVEYCPARVQASAVPSPGAKPGQPSTEYAYRLSAFGPRSVSGDLTIKTSLGWFNAAFSTTSLTQQVLHFRGVGDEYTRTVFRSRVLYIRFPEPLTTEYLWVSDAQSVGDRTFDWDAKGDVRCDPPAAIGLPKEQRNDYHVGRLDPKHALQATPPSDAPMAIATPAGAPGSLACAKPFTDASVTRAVAPRYPQGLEPITTTAMVEVAVGSDGRVDGEWVYSPAPFDALNLASLRAVRQSTFVAGTAFCKPAPGYYLFRTDYER